VAAGLWVGGLGLLCLLLRETRRADPPLREASRFSNVALGAVAVVVVTGTARSIEELGGFGALGDLLGSTYGRALAAKVTLALALIALGAVNRRRSIPRLAEDARLLRRIVGAELAVALGVILLTATLTGAAPNAEADAPEAPGAPSPVIADGTDFATTTVVRLRLAPGAPGPSTIEAHVIDPDGGEPLPADEVTLRVRSVTRPDIPTESVPLAEQGNAWTATTPAFSLAGTYAVTAVVRSGADAVEVPLAVTTRLPDATQTVDVGPGLPTVTTTTFAGGSSIQSYVDPGTAGTNQFHATGFTREGTEQALDDVVIVAIPQDGEPRRLDVADLGPGHVVANVDLEAGDWTFDVVAGADGDVLQATFHETIGAA